MQNVGPAVWDRPEMVASFARSEPNPQLMDYARTHRCPWCSTRVLDIGCGAGRNAVPLADHGFDVIGLDQSRPMLEAVSARHREGRLSIVEATMDALPILDRSVDLIVAHGIWNLARSDDEFRAALDEAGRVAAEDCALFVFTFSRRTLAPSAGPVPGQRYVFTQFSGAPQVFLTQEQLESELGRAGFDKDPDLPLRELNVPSPGQIRTTGAPVIYQGGFRKRGHVRGDRY